VCVCVCVRARACTLLWKGVGVERGCKDKKYDICDVQNSTAAGFLHFHSFATSHFTNVPQTSTSGINMSFDEFHLHYQGTLPYLFLSLSLF
jgi:hypothetical protein